MRVHNPTTIITRAQEKMSIQLLKRKIMKIKVKEMKGLADLKIVLAI